jgi:hypothetical protein
MDNNITKIIRYTIILVDKLKRLIENQAQVKAIRLTLILIYNKTLCQFLSLLKNLF